MRALSLKGIERRAWHWLTPFVPPLLYSTAFGLLWLKPRLYSLSYGNLDPSYIYGVGRAAEQYESFGQQFISNYGPLSYAIINFLPDKAIGLTLWHLLAVLATGFGVYYFCKAYIWGKWLRLFGGSLLLFTLAWAGPEWLYLDVFIVWVFVYLKMEPSVLKQRLLIGLFGVSVLFAYMKFTIGLVSISALSIVVLTERLPDRLTLKSRAIALGGMLLGYSGCLILVGFLLGVTNIFAYAWASFQVASGFSGAMAINDPNLALATKYIFLLFLVFAAWWVIKFKKDVRYYLFLVPALYVVLKYCVTRQDGHVLAIVQVLFPLAVLAYFLKPKIKAYDGMFIALCFLLGVMSLWTNYVDFRQLNLMLIGPLTNVQDKQALRFIDVPAQKKLWSQQTAAWLESARLPDSMRTKIGSEPVDIFPWETVIAEANNLAWHNRPSPYSFETYTDPLDAMNEQFIVRDGPKYIIWHRFGENGVTGIDNRHVLWDGTRTIDALLRHYTVGETTEQFMLLERRTIPLTSKHRTVLARGESTEWLDVPKAAGPVCAQVSIDNTLKQSMQKVLLRQRPFFLEAKYSDGTIRSYRFVREVSAHGLVVSPLPYDWNRLEAFFRRSAALEDKVTHIRINNEPSTKVVFTACNE